MNDSPTLRPRATVIMRTKNCDDIVGQALAALFSQDYKDFELLVVDSGSKDRTLDIVAAYPHRLIQIEPSEYFPGKVLNRAIEASNTELVVFQNSDTVPLVDTALSKLISAFDDPHIHAAFARQLPRPDADNWVRRDYAISFPETPDAPPWMTLSLPLAAMRRSAWEQHPFYTDAWGSEDTEWGKWARDHQLNVQYVPGCIVMHSHNYTLEQLYGRRFIEGEADAFIYGEGETLTKAIGRTVISTVRDWIACVRAQDFLDIPLVPARRAVYHWAHLKGHRHGIHRRITGNPDTRLGQETVLATHESNKANKP